MAEAAKCRSVVVRATGAVAVLARSAALAICIAPLLAVLVRMGVGLDAMRPWRDWSCALPLSIVADLCPTETPPELHRHERFADGVLPAGVLAALALEAYLRPLPWLAWFLALLIGALTAAMIPVSLAIDPSWPATVPVPVWFYNSLGLIAVLPAAPIATDVARFAARRYGANTARCSPTAASAAASDSTPPDA